MLSAEVVARRGPRLHLLVGLDEDLGDLGAGELGRRHFTFAEHLPDLGPRKEQVGISVMRTGLAGSKSLALVAPESVFEHQRLDAEFVDVDVVEDLLRVIGAVVVTGTGVVTTDDEVGRAVVAADDRVEDGLAGAGVVHLRRLDAEHDTVTRVVILHQDFVAAHANVGRDVAGLRLADQRVDEQSVTGLERGLGQVLVGPVDRVTGLEGDDLLPATVGEATRSVSQSSSSHATTADSRQFPGAISSR